MRIVGIGDSHMEGLKLTGGFTNLGVSGTTVGYAIKQLPKVHALKPELLLIWVGTNDINEFNANLNGEYNDLLTQTGQYQTWLITVPQTRWMASLPNDSRDIRRKAFNNLIKQYAQRHIDLDTFDLTSSDGVHLDEASYDKLQRYITKEVNMLFKKGFYLKENHPEYEIGEWSYGDPRIVDWHDGSTLKVGKFCSIAAGTTILLSGEHHYDWVTTYPFICNPDFAGRDDEIFDLTQGIARYIKSKGDVVIGSDVWIGTNALILSGVTIGHGAVVGAGAVVSHDVEPYAVVVGNPAKEIKKRFGEDKIKALLVDPWWDWPIEKIRGSIDNLSREP